jgi:hypothetical protein
VLPPESEEDSDGPEEAGRQDQEVGVAAQHGREVSKVSGGLGGLGGLTRPVRPFETSETTCRTKRRSAAGRCPA